jgi:hypothetical protein
MTIIKDRDAATNWSTQVHGLSGLDHYGRYLNSTLAFENISSEDINAVSSTTFTLQGSGTQTAVSGRKYISYCFHSVEGYSKVGSYTGNGSADGTFVHCGFRPAYVMVKRTDSTSDWQIIDTTRSLYNIHNAELQANQSYSEWAGTDKYDIVSNGFKHRNGYASHNASGGTYIYLAFAEVDFKHSNAR